MSDHHHDHDHDHSVDGDHIRTVKPMVDEITDFEVLEIALRELCIEKGLFTAEQHRGIHRVRRADRSDPGRQAGSKGLA